MFFNRLTAGFSHGKHKQWKHETVSLLGLHLKDIGVNNLAKQKKKQTDEKKEFFFYTNKIDYYSSDHFLRPTT